MEWLQSLLDSSTTPAFTAFLLGLLTALSPCPLATNIAAVGYIGRRVGCNKSVFVNGLLYTAGRIVAYTLLGFILILLLQGGSSLFGVQKYIAKYGEMLIAPALLLIGAYMLWGSRLHLPSWGFGGNGDNLAGRGGLGSFLLGILFALAFCPSSGIFYFGMLIPIAAMTSMGYLLPAIFAVATSLPVLVVAWVLAYSAGKIGDVYGKMQAIQKWMTPIVAVVFILIGIYYCITLYM